MSTAERSDRVGVVDDGRVQELGTHAELLALGGRYAELFELQAAGYR
jgi:ATP-binding cassette subfamily B protein